MDNFPILIYVPEDLRDEFSRLYPSLTRTITQDNSLLVLIRINKGIDRVIVEKSGVINVNLTDFRTILPFLVDYFRECRDPKNVIIAGNKLINRLMEK